MRVLGIDPGSHVTGWGVVEAVGSRMLHVASGVIRAPHEALVARLLAIADALDALLAEHQPQAVSVETVFHSVNAQSAIKLGQARGAALLCAGRFGAPVFEYTAGQIKQAVTGRGRAEKAQVQTMIRLLLGLSEAMPFDASDALAAAMCHAQMHGTPAAQWLRQEGQR